MTTEADIHALEDRRCKAQVAKDVATMNELFADDLIYTHSNAFVDNKQSYIDGIVAKKWDYKAIERPVENIRVSGDTALVTGQIRITLGNPDGTTRTINGRYLNVWLKRQGKWQFSAWQSTSIPA
jgi:uncharacterized protein (TIGR02246 family)